ncbi:MAG: hypothetical protein CMI31_05225 [Opitutae bacterium]|nr:hypothetical protein [Opitutae bacterium]
MLSKSMHSVESVLEHLDNFVLSHSDFLRICKKTWLERIQFSFVKISSFARKLSLIMQLVVETLRGIFIVETNFFTLMERKIAVKLV